VFLFYFTLFYKNKIKKEYLYFSFTCLSIAVYSLHGAFLFNVHSMQEALSFQKGQIASVCLLGVSFAHLMFNYGILFYKKVLTAFSVFCLTSIVAIIFSPIDLLFEINTKEPITVVLPYLFPVVYYDNPMSVFSGSIIGGMVLMFVYMLFAALKTYQIKKEKKFLHMLIALLIFFAGVINDTFVAFRFYEFLYITEYTYFGIVVVIFLSLINEIENYRNNLENLVIDKTNEIWEAQERMRLAFQTIPDAVFVLDAQTQNIVEVNIGFEKTTEYKRKEVIGKSISDISLFDLMSNIELFREKLLKNRTINDIKINLRKKDGKKIPCTFSSVVFKYKEKLHVLSIAKDISEETEMQKQLFLASKLASVGELAAGVAHEIKNPLAIIQGNLELMSEYTDKDSKKRKISFEKTQNSIDRINNIVNGLRLYARKDNEEAEIFSVKNEVEVATSLIEPLYKKKGIELIREYCDDDVQIFGNKGKLQQVTMNLLSNAKDAVEDDKRIIIRISILKKYIELQIIDFGLGIEPKYLDRVTDAFFTTKPPGVGTGLGLSISHSLVLSMNGQLKIKSKPKKGTTVSVIFPIAKK